jgi:predicted Holliday junction resolvase-like endonuclease
MLNSEIVIFKKVIHLMGAKIRYLQDEVMDKDKLERDLFKVTHLNMKMENQYNRMREENRKLNEKIEIMRKVMFEFDN